MDFLLSWDHELFRLINQVWTSPLADSILPLVRNKYIWFPLYVFILCYIFIRHQFPKSGIIALGLLSCVISTDIASSQLIKKQVRRTRPCNEWVIAHQVDERVRCGYGFSFPSSHAANHTAMATFLILVLAMPFYMELLLVIWVMIICYAQMYVGVHYPLDIIAGSLFGYLIARLWSMLVNLQLSMNP